MRLYLDQDLAIADLALSEQWTTAREVQALEYARKQEADFVLVFRGSTTLHVMLVPPERSAA